MARFAFNLAAAVSLLLAVFVATLWFRQTHPVAAAATRFGEDNDRTVQYVLDRQLPWIRIDGALLVDVIDFLRDLSGTNVAANWRAIEAAGISRNKPFTLALRGSKQSSVFGQVLDKAGLAYVEDGSIVCISTRQDLRRVGCQYRPSWPWPSDQDLGMDDRLVGRPTLAGSPSLQMAFAAITRENGIRIDGKWDELEPLGIRRETPFDVPTGARAHEWLDAILRNVSVDHDLQYSFRDGKLLVAPRKWFEREERPRQRAALAVAGGLGFAWAALLIGLRRSAWRRAFLFSTVLVLAAPVAAGVWKIRRPSMLMIAFDGRWALGVTPDHLFRIERKPVALPVRHPAAAFSFSSARLGLRFEQTGPPRSEMSAGAPVGGVIGFFLLLPACWVWLAWRKRAQAVRRRSPNRCVRCGYDLRASAGLCPECGSPTRCPPSTSPPTPGAEFSLSASGAGRER